MSRASPALLSRWLAQPTELLFPRLLRSQQRQLPSRRFLTLQSRSSQARKPKTALNNSPATSQSSSSSFASSTSRFCRAQRRFNSTKSSTPGSTSSQAQSQAQKQAPQGLSQRLRTLSREYGWAALGVYLGLSALDFPVCFVAVQLLGVDRIGHWEHVIVSSVKNAVHSVWPSTWSQSRRGEAHDGKRDEEGDEGSESQSKASIWTQLALAYAVHKSLIFIRVPLTAAATPKIVKVLRRWGWDIGKRKPKST
ncbi:Uncharacterized protein PECH_008860 [Penicillium ucsense]|uniref:DUF1279 domain-containing protein n=1 Tax=Penicillium ucsense TaxID=2839758 RepID=A0A8J8VZ83_9EURO|nr:Uncharacterized protein PECM_008434 [Penicillium ucsense]KAF7733856.1 Uncharacterized protein PECH_008860 [Penicillium ucsense]